MKHSVLNLPVLVLGKLTKWLSIVAMVTMLTACQLPFMTKPSETTAQGEQKEPIVTAKTNDSGFGGTGQVAKTKPTKSSKNQVAKLEASGSGFGGTGIVGTINKFGSVWVNGIEVEYPKNVTVTSNLLSNDTLKIGQQIIVETVFDKNLPWTQKIEIFYPLAGKIELVKDDHLMVDGKVVFISKTTKIQKGVTLERGKYIAVSGYPNIDKSWNATLISRNSAKKHLYQKVPKTNFSKRVKTLAIQTTAAQLAEWDQQFEGLPLTFIQSSDSASQLLLLKAEVKKGEITRYELKKIKASSNANK